MLSVSPQSVNKGSHQRPHAAKARELHTFFGAIKVAEIPIRL